MIEAHLVISIARNGCQSRAIVRDGCRSEANGKRFAGNTENIRVVVAFRAESYPFYSS